MIIGECPCCDATMWNACAGKTPVFEKIVCEECGGVVWLYHSRIDPMAYTEADFLKEYSINESDKSIKRRVKE